MPGAARPRLSLPEYDHRMTETVHGSVLHQKHQQEVFSGNKKAIPGASWNGSRFLSRSSTATCCELSITDSTLVFKTEASIWFENVFYWDVGIVSCLSLLHFEQKIISQHLY